MDKRKILAITIVCIGSMCCSNVLAGVKKGDKEIEGRASLSIPDEGDERWRLSGAYSVFVTDQTSFGAYAGLGGSGGNTSGTLSARMAYHFLSDTETIPYFRVNGGLRLSDSDTSYALGLGGGLKQFIRENLAVVYDLGYDIYGSSGSADASGSLEASIGLSHFF